MKDTFIWLVYAGLGVQMTTSARAIDCMAIKGRGLFKW